MKTLTAGAFLLFSFMSNLSIGATLKNKEFAPIVAEGSGEAYRIVRLCRPSTLSNIFSETTGPIVTKFHTCPSGVWGMQICLNYPCYMTNMAATHINDKNLKNLLSRAN